MKVVLFCGGYGMRMRSDRTDEIPKPMQMVGPRPLLWHIMKYYAHFGHTEFILCLGYGGTKIKEFFLDYHEEASNDFVMHRNRVELLHTDISDWSITFVDTGLESSIGERLRRVRNYLGGDQHFLANYADVLTDAPLDRMIERYHESGATAALLVVPPQSSFHCVDLAENGEIKEIVPVSHFPIWENGGYFVLNREIFELLPPGGDLVTDVCGTLAGRGRLFGYRHDGFWKPADTFKERAELDDNYARGIRPWMLWEPTAVAVQS
ncbi:MULTISPECIES: glucose-1-phosphate cytidylyltransferase [Rhodococcus]|jgi:glucose-1-phosphate cytidylyltransferase|uniref:Glucose-1-phosphate cytidylyltransferase n=1 Tax=Rhodococcus aetherivorans TaxID=191292 RepID=A0A059MWT3_9NOCA|nr:MULTISPECIES: glucose-1-phosphate cytidylyltransferase [Rhodococcus]ETT25491.1 Glucose-1-phosphate cytidylyltransferase [Rhodococcus rhodochrous ATCC 21198]NCL78309.1 Glucose-1-phosphate cytidylyltransferase [Rhodococcus sp. YH1]AKE89108.1 glucose-1-phosphate cytidylyltransferase [Rhodococcus aetherivorans]ANZ26192.1 glucose-1-phosphate cytidylyltransferase [Rhodococcus sp. WB1]KDE15336.1 glucose-1-phosphate cytidylyltransferase [Rhodococcus aetherivorans]